MRHPTVSQTTIVFAFAGDLWSVPRAGGEATRLTSGVGTESDPYFSPDGSTIAFSGQYDGNTDVYTIPATGGVPKRLTAHPDADTVTGWTPDGKSVIFSSSMLSPTDYPRLFTVSTKGGVPKPLPFPAGVEASMSPDGKRLAYVPNGKWELAWKRYRGGQAAPIWVADLADSKWKAIPRGDEDCKDPMWMDNAIYYVSDPKGIMGMYRFDVATGRVTEVVPGEGFDIKSATAGPGVIAYEKLGSIWLYDLNKRTSSRVSIDIKGDFPEVRPEFKTLRPTGYSISPTGQRVAVTARGLVFTVPASKGDARQIDGPAGIERKDPAWSPDGKTLAYITEAEDRQQLALVDLASGKERLVALAESPSVYANPKWSPDSKKIAYEDVRLNLWVLDVATGTSTKIDTGTYRGTSDPQAAWSPDSKWIAYCKDGENHLQSVMLHEISTGKKVTLTDGLADATSPVFDRDNKHLYFMASTDVGLASDIQDIAQLTHPNGTSSVYAVVLKKGGPNPLQPESDEEGPAKKPEPPQTATPIDPEGIEARIVALPIPKGEYNRLVAGPAGSFFVLGGGNLSKFSFSDRKVTPFASGVFGAEPTADGTKLLLIGAGGVRIVPTAAPATTPGPAVDMSGLRAKIDPKAEWERMYHAVWRNERALFYDPKLHGIDAAVMEKRYEPFLANVASRDDLNYLFTDMLGELSVGHMWARGGDLPGGVARVPGGLLGCDFSLENGHYRITRVYNGERWNPGLYGPLAQPGVEAKAGEYLLEIDGKPLDDALDIYETLEGKAGKQVKVKIGPTPDGAGAREAIVVPVASEASLRFRAWAEDNRRLVDKMTGGKVGYAHIPDTGGGGWTEFNRYYYAQQGKSGMIIDDRFNHGGYVADFFVREMIKPVVYGSRTRYGRDWTIPPSGVYGPKVMLANEMAGSGGDIFPHLFKLHNAGKVVGKRTWGAMISAASFRLVDGGSVNAPDDAIYDPVKGEWVIEGWGTDPDIEVEYDPYLWRQGHDAQLERAITEILKELPDSKPALQKRPEYPNKTKPQKGDRLPR
jgi:tricorn protease